MFPEAQEMPKVMLVTGCGSGIGRTTAEEALRAGHVVYAGLRDAHAPGVPGAIMLALDVTKPDERRAALERVLAEQGRLDALVNNAGVALGGFLELVEEDELRHVLDVNLLGAWAMTRDALPILRRSSRSTVVFVSSMSGRMAFPGLGAYACSKFALEGLAEAWRHELSAQGVRVVLVEPGAYRTELFGRNRRLARRMADPGPPYAAWAAGLDALYHRLAERKARDPVEVARLIVALCEARRPGLRHPIGPWARVRTLLLRLTPFGLVEGLVAWGLRRSLRG